MLLNARCIIRCLQHYYGQFCAQSPSPHSSTRQLLYLKAITGEITLQRWDPKQNQKASLIMPKRTSFAIIGGGPAAFYTSKLLAKLPSNPLIHIIQKELCPFGLIRYGVAPDHISIKKSEMTLSDTANNPSFSFFGNVNVTPQSYKRIRDMYSGVVFAYGASRNHVPSWYAKKPASSQQHQRIPSNTHSQSQSPNVKFARDIVYWYNGHPSADQPDRPKISLKGIKNVVIIGNGNVAIDVGRILLRNPQDFKQSEMAEGALNQLIQNNKVETVQIIGRRGVTHSAFSIKQVRELHRLGIKLYAVMEDLEESMTESSTVEITALGNHFSSAVRMNKRKVDFIRESFEIISEEDIPKVKALSDGSKRIIFRYLLTPHEVRESEDRIICCKSVLEGEPFKQRSVPNLHELVSIHYDLLVLSTGFQVGQLEPQHYDRHKKKLLNSDGCVVKVKENKIDIGVYATGWCKNGPQGVLDETLLTCEETFNNIRIHVSNGLLQDKPEPEPLRQDGQHVSFSQYLRLREWELEQGMRERFVKKKMNSKQIRQFYGLPPAEY